MLNVTDEAASLLHQSLEASEGGDDSVLRLSRAGDGFALRIDEEREGDQVVTHDERKILVVDADIAKEMDGATVDAVETPEGKSLILKGG